MAGPSWLDRAIGIVAPRAALRRVQARDALDLLGRGYDGAAKGRRTEGWRSPGTSADAEIAAAGGLLRDRMRDLVRNNPHAAKAVSVLVNNLIGSGIIPRAASGDGKLDSQATALWDAWSVRCDADGQLDFLGLQTLACSIGKTNALLPRTSSAGAAGVLPAAGTKADDPRSLWVLPAVSGRA